MPHTDAHHKAGATHILTGIARTVQRLINTGMSSRLRLPAGDVSFEAGLATTSLRKALDALARLETLVLLGGVALPLPAVRSQLAKVFGLAEDRFRIVCDDMGGGFGARGYAYPEHAALLFADFVLSPEGQELFNSMGRVPASLKVKSNLNNFKYTMVDPATVLDESEKWERLWGEFFLRK